MDHDRIADAVQEAEERTSGEIVPVVIEQCVEPDLAIWRGASVAALGALVVVLAVTELTSSWGMGWLYTPTGVGLVLTLAGTGGALAARFIPPLTRILTGTDRLDLAVHQRAMQAFVEEEVFQTRDRTGILIFVSLMEHRIEVLGDTGINEQVEPDDWTGVVDRIRTGLQNDNLTTGLVDAIGMCGRLLERKGVSIRPDDEDELSNRPRTPEE